MTRGPVSGHSTHTVDTWGWCTHTRRVAQENTGQEQLLTETPGPLGEGQQWGNLGTCLDPQPPVACGKGLLTSRMWRECKQLLLCV